MHSLVRSDSYTTRCRSNGRSPQLQRSVGGYHRRRVCRRLFNRGSSHSGFWSRTGVPVALAQPGSDCNHVYRDDRGLAHRRAVAVGRLRRLSHRPTTDQVGGRAYARGVFSGHGQWIPRLGGRERSWRGNLGVGRIIPGRRCHARGYENCRRGGSRRKPKGQRQPARDR